MKRLTDRRFKCRLNARSLAGFSFLSRLLGTGAFAPSLPRVQVSILSVRKVDGYEETQEEG